MIVFPYRGSVDRSLQLQETNLRLGPRAIRVHEAPRPGRRRADVNVTSNTGTELPRATHEVNIAKSLAPPSHQLTYLGLSLLLLMLHSSFYRRSVYGNNEIVIPVKSILTLLCLEVLNPFYIFQLFSFCLWVADDYYYYAMVILFMSSVGILMAVFQTRRVRNFSFPSCRIPIAIINLGEFFHRTSTIYGPQCILPMWRQ